LSRTTDESKAVLEAVRPSQAFKTRITEGSPDCMKVLGLDRRLLAMNEVNRVHVCI